MKRFLLGSIILAALVPYAVMAQGGVSLESLADLLAVLTGRVDDLSERVQLMEAIWEPQGAPELPDGSCSLLQLDPAGRIVILQRPTIQHHLRQFDTYPVATKLRHVRHDPESGLTYMVYETWHEGKAYYALEGWRGCDFEEGTEWIGAEG